MKELFYKLTSLTVIVLISIFLNGCLGTSQGIPYYTISDEFAQYCWFEAGSKWTYQNDQTEESGDVIIGEVLESQRFNPENEDYNYQAVEMILMNNVFNLSKIELTAGDYQAGEGEMNSLMRFYYTDSTYQLIFMPQYPIGEEIILGDQLGSYLNMEIMPTYEVLGTSYPEVWHTRIVTSSPSVELHFFVAKGYGLVQSRKVVSGEPEETMSLKSSSLVPRILE